MANITEFATGYPGYTSIIPKSVGTIGNILVNNGYNTAWFGKHHLVPEWMQGPGGPVRPMGRGLGFEYFYGFLGGDTDQWHPALFENTTPVLPPFGDPNYILIRDLADRSINWIRTQHAAAPDKPFFLYFAPGNSHAPHHAPKDWIAKFKGQFDQGWDKVREETLARQKKLGVVPADTVLTPRPKEIPAWDSLSADQKKVYARMMEVYAAATAQCDHEIGRILDALQESGQLDNTLVIYLEGDNGASAEGTMQGTTNEVSAQFAPESIEFLVSMMDELGSDRTYNHYPIGWAHAMDTPFQWTKQVASHFGGTRNGLAVSWPKRIKAARRTAVAVPPCHRHRADDPGGGRHPGPAAAQRHAAKADGRRQHGLHVRRREGPDAAHDPVFRNDGQPRDLSRWLDRQHHALRGPWQTLGAAPDPDDYPWELYNLADDFSQSKNLAKENPKKLLDLQSRFLMEAVKYNVLPIDSSFADRMDPAMPPKSPPRQDRLHLLPGHDPHSGSELGRCTSQIVSCHCRRGDPGRRSRRRAGDSGRTFRRLGLLVLDGKPMFAYAYTNQDGEKYPSNRTRTRPASPAPTSSRRESTRSTSISSTMAAASAKAAWQRFRSMARTVAEGRIEKTSPLGKFSLDESFDVGQDTGTPVIDDYDAKMPFKFTGALNKVVIHLGATAHPRTTRRVGEAEGGILHWRRSDGLASTNCCFPEHLRSTALKPPMPPASAVSEPLEVRGLDWTTEGAARPEAHVVRSGSTEHREPLLEPLSPSESRTAKSFTCDRYAPGGSARGSTLPVPLRSARKRRQRHGDTPARNVEPSDLLRRLIPAWFREALVGAVLPSFFAYTFLPGRMTHLKPTWLVDVSVGCGWRAAAGSGGSSSERTNVSRPSRPCADRMSG